MIAAKVPELADGGYWYVVAVKPDPEGGSGTVPDIPAGMPFAKWMDDGSKCVVRVLTPIAGVEDIGKPGDLLPIPRKPRARIEGR